MATIREVADKAGVSVATVSRAINDSGYVGKEAKRKIMKAVKELNYKPNEVARSLYQKSSKMIGLLLPDIANPFFPLIAKGVEDVAQEKGYMVLLGNVEGDSHREQKYIDFFSQYNVSGVLSASSEAQTFGKGIPIVFLDRVKDRKNFFVTVDHFKGGQLAAQTILKSKPRKVVIMVGPRHVDVAVDRLQGAESILNESQIDYELFETRTYQAEDAEKTAEELLNNFENIDSIIANNDIFALAIIKEALKRGLRVPEDIQIIGYDNTPFSNFMNPQLTTVAQPGYEIGYEAAQILFKIIDKETVHKSVSLEPYVIERESLRKVGEQKNG
ncbi:LacI family transcriptional regulator [Tetragenococcus koreensis]|uniref:LacI family DNA-binding transcriptional regulator n=1 Tax=Tetragenococcus koreensis TaxID=290335 RepID=UPI000F50C29D|nr:LacI family DNA-binding transcriptional regulator [Tetragenococcus koreensis]MDN6291618.1 LacI family transcriptional regulator [Tetragenococcus halophilus]MDN6631378.1 LacI family transcriptional regulator [Staphylococcus equorum]MDN6730731.1 LacI family transcriptional regulator [Atopostipes suicloacalis]AYW46522.1 LacI family transcriptional regulator [Tetragenococcus koreensis]MCF1585346.1 LacI family transcriptional regulator [Tetragenococcus koreensis]